MGITCSAYEERCIQGFVGKPEKKSLGVGGRIIVKRMFKKWNGGMYWIDWAHDRDGWRAIVNVVMNLRIT
jgi:hypothetical protein